jgi:SAM-dependent methyltransferase
MRNLPWSSEELATFPDKLLSTHLKIYNKRFAPSFSEHDWYVLRSLSNCLVARVNESALMQNAQTIVDMGCGSCPYRALFEYNNCRYISCDLSGSVDITLRPSQRVELTDSMADGVVSFQVLEHVWDLHWYLSECYRILKPGGWLLLSTHGAWPYHAHPTDFRRWTRDGLVGELSNQCFSVEHVDALVGPLAWTTQFRLLGIRQFLRSLPYIGAMILYPLIFLTNLRIIIEDAITPASIRDVNASIYVALCRKQAQT